MTAEQAECLGYEICTTAGGNILAVVGGFVLIWLLWKYAP